MSYFSKYTSQYKNPERYASDITSRTLRKVQRELERNYELQLKWGRLSPESEIANRDYLNRVRETAERLNRDVLSRDKVVPESDVRRSFAGELKRASYATLTPKGFERAQRFAAGTVRRRRAQAGPVAADMRSFHPLGDDVVYPRDVSGNEADLALGSRGWIPSFVSPGMVIPCIQRAVRREVMFATKRGGRGYRGKRRRSPFGGIPC